MFLPALESYCNYLDNKILEPRGIEPLTSSMPLRRLYLQLWCPVSGDLEHEDKGKRPRSELKKRK